MKNRKLFVIDLDGTSLINQNELHPDLIKDVKVARKQGHIVAIATGRSYNSSIKFYKQLKLNTYLSNCNGNFINNPLDKSHPLVMHTFSSKIIAKILENKAFRDGIKGLIIENSKILKATPNIDEKIKVWYKATPISQISLDQPIVEEQVLTSMVFIKRELKKEIYNFITMLDEVSIYVIDNWSNDVLILELFSKKGTKGRAVSLLQLKYQIESKNIHVFGDSFNDIPMFALPGVNSYAVGNAVDELKNISTKVLQLSHKENAVGQEIRKIIKEE